jgi:hypothetical protein
MSDTIYVALREEAVECWRPVRAEQIGVDTYLIVDAIPEGEVWEFQPGEVVWCARRAFPDQATTALVALEKVLM